MNAERNGAALQRLEEVPERQPEYRVEDGPSSPSRLAFS
jgi:hypothetical protein